MNAAAVSNDSMQENGDGSDSDSYSEDSPEYYQPISAGNDHEDVSDEETSDLNSNGGVDSSFRRRLPNGYPDGVGDRISSLDLSDDEDGATETKSNSSTDEKTAEEEEEEMRMREASDLALRRALMEDESRRRAPLPAETSTRVMEAMRGVSFTGITPHWADRVPEDEWINRLRTLAQSQTTPTTIQD